MREILFRGQRIDNGEWVEGDLIQIGGGALIYHGDKKEVEVIKQEDSPCSVGFYPNEISVVIPKTVGQFTGLTDKNGVKIFEGDILLFGDTSFVVEWKNDITGFGFLDSSDRFLGCDGINCEVIGDIH
jgi:uncharacterized phage protein (TIGR01671 family)